jgi:hypothetical protein
MWRPFVCEDGSLRPYTQMDAACAVPLLVLVSTNSLSKWQNIHTSFYSADFKGDFIINAAFHLVQDLFDYFHLGNESHL